LSVTFGLASQCQALIEELLASHSTDLQQRAYELQAVIALDPQSVESVLPFDASCEDIEVISLLNLAPVLHFAYSNTSFPLLNFLSIVDQFKAVNSTFVRIPSLLFVWKISLI